MINIGNTEFTSKFMKDRMKTKGGGKKERVCVCVCRGGGGGGGNHTSARESKGARLTLTEKKIGGEKAHT